MKNIFSTRHAASVAPDIATGTDNPGGDVRAVIDAVLPAVDNGRFAVKCVAGERVCVRAHCFTDGHDVLRVQLCWRAHDQAEFREVPMKPLGNDVWEAGFSPPAIGRYVYTAVAWVDPFESWRSEMTRRVDPDDVRIASEVGAAEVAAAAARAEGADRIALQRWATELQASAAAPGTDAVSLKALALDEELAELARRHPDRRHQVRHPVELPLVADRERARFSTWYELFPRSAGTEPGVHGTFKDVEARLPAIAEMGFDVLYFPPIHPIGRVQRKGPNNKLVSGPEDVGSPWAIGAAEGGHKDILPALGTAQDFRRLLARAADHGLEIALDIAFQCAPDHPYVKAHPEWFRWRPDGTVQYAENPPKKYQDIYPFNFESEDWRGLWAELKSVIDHWVGEGVRIFRVDNPHTKAFPFWEWAIGEVKREHPDVIFLAEAFTRPKVMHRLAKLGFSQSYTYFTWRNTKEELVEYFTELSTAPGIDYFRPNVWPNTPDILHEQLQHGDAATYMARLVLAATLSASYGIYGPAYELREHLPREPGSEEYLDSEKYQLRHWNHDNPESLAPFIARVNRIRRENPALHQDRTLRFLHIDNPQLLAYAKASPDGANVIVTVVNLDPHNAQWGWLGLEPGSVGVNPPSRVFQMHDLLSGQRFQWQGDWHYVRLDPQSCPAHVFVVRRRHGDERDFDYFL
ncbi:MULTISPECIES: alpha-1,4-glucan--maltose-1-phosphate maltosyltransferase [unclassified Variovorax]|uniref:alpha-1,4-glucan--maltose-1-phosphate maltosyltransferase n=1 Tax=unclassified Variovorax TaxID=663243 RepID=UPI000D12E9AE|nr:MULTISPECIES: alpha-1,4-glucan--maltose-1-phosphate maltosyltransferase [unclassified Variovorax]AVQ79841.1 alpha-1,4-glucan--maltose-1-phosphate maltosyltransferase [Variovorax sp. PMC12]QRY30817.1 alpha-1,4-glucan--maltose-1-phosphate maltosyltransferase [Variovorax sp. PDNC026]